MEKFSAVIGRRCISLVPEVEGTCGEIRELRVADILGPWTFGISDTDLVVVARVVDEPRASLSSQVKGGLSAQAGDSVEDDDVTTVLSSVAVVVSVMMENE